jgi:UDP-N-acetylmuramyl pentapeptide phosphotransferase/UDP-N-acetylglucosamine-1-phosphate transferase
MNEINTLFYLIGSFTLSYLMLPKIIGFVKHKNLMDDPITRSSHENKVPTLGGIVFYVILMLSFYFIKEHDQFHVTEILIPGLLILFIVGVKDDLMVLSPYLKLVAQFVSVLFVLNQPYFHLSNLPLSSFELFSTIDTVFYFFALIFMVFMINAFNFIDGIDGLAGGIGLIIFGCYYFFFSLINDYFMMALYSLLFGSLLSFLFYNFSTNKKIFMGDTGSLVLGFMIAIGAIRLFIVSKTISLDLPFTKIQFLLIVISIIFIPLYDSSRVIIIRLLNKKSPFHPDRNHLHHFLLDFFEIKHYKISIIIYCINLFLILLMIVVSFFFSTNSTLITFICYVNFLLLLPLILKKISNKA